MADRTFAELEAEYCPPLDPALLSAILSDYNLNDPQSVQSARSTLDPLKDSATLEEQIGFDASGTGGSQNLFLEDERRDESLPETSGESVSRDTEFTSLSNGLSSLDLEKDFEDHEAISVGVEDVEKLEGLDKDTKIQLLVDIFGKRVSRYSIKYTLQKCHGKWMMAMEELLNYVHFGDTDTNEDGEKVALKSIDAFAEDAMIKPGRKGKAKNRRYKQPDGERSISSPSSPVSGAAPGQNKWNSAGQEIDFVVQRTGLSPAVVSSTYYHNGATLPKTIGALLKSIIDKKDVVNGTDDETITSRARELGLEFPIIAPDYLLALIKLTHPSTASAHELAKALTTPKRDARPVGLQIITNYQPPEGVETEALPRSAVKQSRSAGVSVESTFSDDVDAVARAKAYATARNMAFAQAQAAHRRAKSDRLMGGAAAYYGQRSRDLAALSFQARATASDELAESQSSASQLDLHGVDVANAVRIAQDKVERWWSNLGENRVNGRVGAEDRQSGFCIVVGLGKHSEGGKSKIGPAVKKVLREGGWKFEDGGATILVKGRMKR